MGSCRRCLTWLKSCSNGVAEHEDEGNYILTSTVRDTYVVYLQKTLKHNFEVSGLIKSINENTIGELVKQYAHELEQEAIKQSTVTRLYQSSMSDFIKSIKKSTDEPKLYGPFEKFMSKQDERKTRDQESQTDFSEFSLIQGKPMTDELSPTAISFLSLPEISELDRNGRTNELVRDPIEENQLFDEFLKDQLNLFSDILKNPTGMIESDQSINPFDDNLANSMLMSEQDQFGELPVNDKIIIDNNIICNNVPMAVLESSQFFQNNMNSENMLMNGQVQFVNDDKMLINNMRYDQNIIDKYNNVGTNDKMEITEYGNTMSMDTQSMEMVNQNISIYDYTTASDPSSLTTNDQFSMDYGHENITNGTVMGYNGNGYNHGYGGLETEHGCLGNDEGMKNDWQNTCEGFQSVDEIKIDPPVISQQDMVPNDHFEGISVDELYINDFYGVVQNADIKCDEKTNLPKPSSKIGEERKGKINDEKISVDERLRLLGFLAESDDDTSEKRKSELKKEYLRRMLKMNDPDYVELLAITYQFKSSMKEAPKRLQDKLTRIYNNVFGNDHNVSYASFPDRYLSLACRKRIARIVVLNLTKYFDEGRITSKGVFKRMAKYVTSRILDNYLFPDSSTVRKSVDEFFSFNRIIHQDSDFMISS